MHRTRALILLAAALVVGAIGVAAAATARNGSGARARAAQLRTFSLLPFSRGQLLVSVGTPPSWQPVADQPTTVTLFSGRPALRSKSGINAYVGFQRTTRRCPAKASQDSTHELTIANFYASSHLVTRSSPFAPGGGSQRGDYAVSVPDVVLTGSHAVKACIWLSKKPSKRSRATSQDIPLLNGMFAASVSNVPSASPGQGNAYTLDAVDVARTFSYSALTLECGTSYTDRPRSVAPGTLGTETISVLKSPCSGDGSTFSFSSGSGASLGRLAYPAGDAIAAPPVAVPLGACELDPVTVTPVTDAEQYVESVGCSVGRLLVAAPERGIPRGAVVEAQVDGGIAQVAPRGSVVDPVLNGR
jgi:hypothetical protein